MMSAAHEVLWNGRSQQRDVVSSKKAIDYRVVLNLSLMS